MSTLRRGRPLGFLASVVLGWTALRIAVLALPPEPAAAEALAMQRSDRTPTQSATAPRRAAVPDLAGAWRQVVRPALPPRPSPIMPAQTPPLRRAALPVTTGATVRRKGEVPGLMPTKSASSVTSLASNSALRPMAAVPPVPLAPTGMRRWQVDAWLLLREPGPEGSTAPRASYGAAQVGARLAYGLVPSSPHRPAVYVRASKALIAGGETEAAAGLAARPLPALPLTVHAELRATHFAGATSVRPAAFATVQVDETLPTAPVRLRAYGQAGYVAGDYATPFADGQASIAGTFAAGPMRIEAGGGVWAGAQKGVGRIDAGPLVAAEFEAGRARLRVSAEYRVRVAGDAVPGSGPALTVTAGF